MNRIEAPLFVSIVAELTERWTCAPISTCWTRPIFGITVLGIGPLWRAWRRPSVPKSGRTLFRSAILGWGIFNLVEGIVDHHLLSIHHVWPDGPGPVILWDVGFLVWGLLFIVGGYAIVRGDDAVSPAPDVGQVRTEQNGY